jgi:hypothetical protein
MRTKYERIAANKMELDRLRPIVGAGLGNLEHIQISG